jgi:hypothetical protein
MGHAVFVNKSYCKQDVAQV